MGAPNSSNSNRLVEVAKRHGSGFSQLVERADDIPWNHICTDQTLGLSAGASAPEVLVDEIINAIRQRYTVHLETRQIRKERVTFKLPKVLQNA